MYCLVGFVGWVDWLTCCCYVCYHVGSLMIHRAPTVIVTVTFDNGFLPFHHLHLTRTQFVDE